MREIKIPFTIDEGGFIAYVEGEKAITQQHVVSVVATQQEERVMRPTYGTRIRERLFDPDEPVLHSIVESSIRDAVRDWVPNVAIHQVQLRPLPENVEYSGVAMQVSYRMATPLGEGEPSNSAELTLTRVESEAHG